MMRFGRMFWPSLYRGQNSVQRRHCSQTLRARFMAASIGSLAFSMRGWFWGRTMSVSVRRVTTAASMADWADKTRPRIGPPTMSAASPITPAALIHAERRAPTGTFRKSGFWTAPKTVRYRSVTGVSSRAFKISSASEAVITAQCASRGVPRSGTDLPVTR